MLHIANLIFLPGLSDSDLFDKNHTVKVVTVAAETVRKIFVDSVNYSKCNLEYALK